MNDARIKFHNQLASIFADIGQVFLASLIIPLFTKQHYFEAFAAIFFAIIFWSLSLIFTQLK